MLHVKLVATKHSPDEPVEEKCQELDSDFHEVASTGFVVLLLACCPVVQESNQQTAVTVPWLVRL